MEPLETPPCFLSTRCILYHSVTLNVCHPSGSVSLIHLGTLIFSMVRVLIVPEATLLLVTKVAFLHKPPHVAPRQLSRLPALHTSGGTALQDPRPQSLYCSERQAQMTPELSASRTAPSARRRGRHTFSVPTATAGSAAPAPKSTSMALPLGVRSSPRARRDLQVSLLALPTRSHALKQCWTLKSWENSSLTLFPRCWWRWWWR